MPTKSTRLAEFMPYRLSVTSNGVSDMIAKQYRQRFGLKIPEWRVMAILGDAGGLTQRQLVGATRMDKVAINRACKVLEDRGLLARSPNARDGRSHHLGLTPSGREMFEEIMPLALEMEKRVFSCLSQREFHLLKELLGKVDENTAALEAEGAATARRA